MYQTSIETESNRISRDLNAQGISDITLWANRGAKEVFCRDQADLPPLIKSMMFKAEPAVIVQPHSATAVSAILSYASKKKIPITPRGAGSSPFGGAVPVKGGIVIDMSVMDQVISIDEQKKEAKVQAGTRWGDLDWQLEPKGLAIRSCPSSRFSTVGGWLATGGVGVESFSGGPFSDSVVEAEIVLPSGEIKTITPSDCLFKSLAGSEGRVAVITSITLKLKERRKVTPHLFVFSTTDQAIDFAEEVASTEIYPDDIVYYHEAKFGHLNKILGKKVFVESPGIVMTGWNLPQGNALRSLARKFGGREEEDYKASLAWNERFFPMKFRLLGPGMLGSEAIVPKDHFKAAVKAAETTARLYGLEPIMESHFVKGGERLVLCYYITDQTRLASYMMDAVRSLLIMTAMVDEGAKAYSTGLWYHVFLDKKEPTHSEREALKKEIDPSASLNPGKGKVLAGSMGGIPAKLLSPSMAPVLRLLNNAMPLTSRALALVQNVEGVVLGAQDLSELTHAANACAMCGACVNVCPAYQATKDDRVTARGKLLTARMMDQGRGISKEHAQRTFLCMRCKACEQVCQSKLHLLPLYDELEAKLEAKYGRDLDEITKFVQYVESSPEYDVLLKKGLVIGAPRNGMDGRDGSV
ncbi:MAG: glycolate oxidase subunit GlcD [Methanomassiliicoccales archaeon PtaU1.Bin124]|nr:MAG: glycolate oxidase subunit GlcD [Methanomassiliicoccales archaeon PtaU1.Bin124]